MRTLKAGPLSMEAFAPFGQYANFIDPDALKIGAPPIEFFRDMVPLNLGGSNLPSFSVCRVEKREMIIDATEYHDTSGEGIMPLDGDVLMHVGPAVPPGQAPPLDEFRVFHVPRGTFVALNPGVWHHGPFTVSGAPVSSLIVLPQRLYAVDCSTVELGGEDCIRVEM
jgi:ureidoglycolate lyase